MKCFCQITNDEARIYWYGDLDDVFHKRLIISHRKNLCQGDYLIDDRGKNGTSEFAGEWIEFGSGQFPNWESVLRYLLSEKKEQ